MNMLTIKCRLTFTEELLGTASNNPEIHSEFVASKGPDAMTREEEVAAICKKGPGYPRGPFFVQYPKLKHRKNPV